MTAYYAPLAAFLQAEPLRQGGVLSPLRLIQVLVILAAAWTLARLTGFLLPYLRRRLPHAHSLLRRFEPAVRIAVWCLALLGLFLLLAPSREALLVAAAAMAIAVGLGARDLVRNLAGGLAILTDRMFQVGDWVRIGEAYGEIVHIGFRSTRLKTAGGAPVIVPNADVLIKEVFNASAGAEDCEVAADVFLPPDADPSEASRICYEAASSSPYLRPGSLVSVQLIDGFAHRPFLTARILARVYDHRFENEMRSDVTLRAKTELRKRGLLDGWRDPAGVLPVAEHR
jgi:small-conductance mechanosensitive channel